MNKSQEVLRVPLGLENVECYPQKRWLLNQIWKDEAISRHSRARSGHVVEEDRQGECQQSTVPDFAII